MPTNNSGASDLVDEGWIYLCAGRYPQAEQAFRAALEHNPLSDEARDGLLESLKASFWPYRLIQRFGVKLTDIALGQGRLSLAWFVSIFGVLPAVLLRLIRKHPNAAPYLWPIFLAIIGYLIAVQLTDYASTLRVRFLTRGRSLVDNALLTNATLGALCMTGTVTALLLYFRIDHFATLLAALLLFLIVIPLDVTFTSTATWVRIPMIGLLLILVACGTATVTIAAIKCQGQDWSEPIPASAGICFLAFIAGVVGSNLLATTLSHSGDQEKVSGKKRGKKRGHH
ncbi:MAG: hypothetical protein ACE5EQ_12080 [Phycisphaerae bacterium]